MKSDGRVRVSAIDWLALALILIGAINWGLVGVGHFLDANLNLVNLIFGAFPTVEALIYVVVGLAGLYELVIAYQLYSATQEPTRASGSAEH